MSPYEAVQVFEHLRDTGVIEEAGEIFGRGACKGLIAEAEAREKLDRAGGPEIQTEIQTFRLKVMADALARALEEGDHTRGCPFRDEADCECWRSVVHDALRAAGRLP